jgi:hypothetical protein
MTRIVSILAVALASAGIASAQTPYAAPRPPSREIVQSAPAQLEADKAPVATDLNRDVAQDPIRYPTRVWASADFLLWWIKDSRFPALATTSSPAAGGILNQGDTRVLFGNSAVDNEERLGGRFSLGYWLDDEQSLGVEGAYLFLGSRTNSFTAGGSGAPGTAVISRPFFNTFTMQQDAERVAFPGELAGTVRVNWSSRLDGAELNGVAMLGGVGALRVEGLAGFRYFELDEGLGIGENLLANPGLPVFGGSRILVADQFGAHNHFYGGQIGARAEWQEDRLFVNAVAKLALGGTDQSVDINGATVFAPPGGVSTLRRGGLLALPSNIGHHDHGDFAVLPEAGVNVGYQITRGLRASLGYSFLYLSSVARPGDQVDFRVDSRQLPLSNGGPSTMTFSHPGVLLRDSDFWAQGLSFGLELRF